MPIAILALLYLFISSVFAQPAQSPLGLDWAIQSGSDPGQIETALATKIKDTGDTPTLYQSIRFLNRQDRADESMSLLKKINRPDDPLYLYHLTETYFYLGNTDSARSTAELIPVKSLDQWIGAQEIVMGIHFLEGRLDDCIKTGENILRHKPNLEAYLFLAQCETLKGQYSKAQKHIEMARVGHPASYRVAETQAELFDAMGREIEAAEVRRALPPRTKANPPATVYENLAMAAAMRLEKHPKASWQCGQIAIRHAPGDPWAALEKSRIFLATSEYDIAKTTAEDVAKRYKNCPLVPLQLAFIMEQSPGYGSLVNQYCREALKISPTQTAAREPLIHSAMICEKWREANSLIEENLKINPSHLPSLRLQTAVKLLKDNARLKSPPDYAFCMLMGRVYNAKPDYSSSLTWYKKALEQRPNDADAQRAIGNALLRMDQVPQARSLLEKSFAANPYDIPTKNMLDFLDDVSQSVEITSGTITIASRKADSSDAAYALYLVDSYVKKQSDIFGIGRFPPVRFQICANYDDMAVLSQGMPFG